MNEDYNNTLTADTDKMLQERGAKYGDFTKNSEIKLKLFAEWCSYSDGLPAYVINSFLEIFSKLSRALSGDVNYLDNYQDIIGYAQKGLDCLESEHILSQAPNLLNLEEFLKVEEQYIDLVKNSASYDKLSPAQKNRIFGILRSCFFIFVKGTMSEFRSVATAFKNIIKCASDLYLATANPEKLLVTYPPSIFGPIETELKLLFFCAEKCGGCQDMKPIIEKMKDRAEETKYRGPFRLPDVVILDKHDEENKDYVQTYYTEHLKQGHISGLPAYSLIVSAPKYEATTFNYAYTFDGQHTQEELEEIIKKWQYFAKLNFLDSKITYAIAD